VQDGSRKNDLINLYYSNNNLQSTGGVGTKSSRKRKLSAGYLAATHSSNKKSIYDEMERKVARESDVKPA